MEIHLLLAVGKIIYRGEERRSAWFTRTIHGGLGKKVAIPLSHPKIPEARYDHLVTAGEEEKTPSIWSRSAGTAGGRPDYSLFRPDA